VDRFFPALTQRTGVPLAWENRHALNTLGPRQEILKKIYRAVTGLPPLANYSSSRRKAFRGPSLEAETAA
jgi:hypothetical protein